MPSWELEVEEIAYRSMSGLHISELPVSKRTRIEVNSFQTTYHIISGQRCQSQAPNSLTPCSCPPYDPRRRGTARQAVRTVFNFIHWTPSGSFRGVGPGLDPGCYPGRPCNHSPYFYCLLKNAALRQRWQISRSRYCVITSSCYTYAGQTHVRLRTCLA